MSAERIPADRERGHSRVWAHTLRIRRCNQRHGVAALVFPSLTDFGNDRVVPIENLKCVNMSLTETR